MRLNRTLRGVFALLFVLLLPLQGYAAMPSCGQHDAASPASHHCDRGAADLHHHSCGDCCGAAIALTPIRWSAPLLAAPEIAATQLGSPPERLLDRLDRPPR